MKLGLEGRRAIITGGSKGLGFAIAQELVREGVHVAICSRNEEEVLAAGEALRESSNVTVHAQPADVTDPEQVRDLVAHAAEALGGIDALVNNAGRAHPGTFETLTDDDWLADLEVKLLSAIRCSREALPHLRTAGGGRIVNIGAIQARAPDPAFFATSVNRAAGNSFTKTLALEVAKDNILVNGVNIGYRRHTAVGQHPPPPRAGSRTRRVPADARRCRGPARSVRQAGRGLRHRRLSPQRPRELHHRRVDRRRRRHGPVSSSAGAIHDGTIYPSRVADDDMINLTCNRAALALVTCMLAASAATATASPRLQGTVEYATFQSKALKGTVHFSIYLPSDYASSGKRYPVIYFLHGLPGTSLSYRSITQVAAALEASGRPAIVVGAQGSRSGDTDPEWRDWRAGRNWETATSSELVSVVDARYRTIAERSGRILIGISAGGYGATLIALHNPSIYSVVESWSGYFHATTPDGTAALELRSEEADDWANAHKLIPRAKRFLSADSTPTYFAFYVGTNDSLFKAENLKFYDELRKAGISDVVFHVYSGGHNWTLWSEHAEAWLGKALIGRSEGAVGTRSLSSVLERCGSLCSVFYLRYLRSELVGRRTRTILTLVGLALGVALVITISGLARGLDHAQKTALNPLSSIGTDLTVTLVAAAGHRRLRRRRRRRQRQGADPGEPVRDHRPLEARQAGHALHPRLLPARARS